MIRSSSSSLIFSLLKRRSIPNSISSISQFQRLSSISTQTHFRSPIKNPNSFFGYLNFPQFSPNFRFQHKMASNSSASDDTIYQFTVKDASGKDVNLGEYKDKVLLIVNVASQCGLTNSNYTEMSELYEKYKDKGLEILAFPCNQFGNQEPGTNDEIKEFACTRFKAEYPIFDKVEVNGEGAAPIYKYLKQNKGGLFGDGIKWNFTKFLVNKNGKVVERYAPTTSPSSIEKDIKKELGI